MNLSQKPLHAMLLCADQWRILDCKDVDGVPGYLFGWRFPGPLKRLYARLDPGFPRGEPTYYLAKFSA